ncbi:periplasmic heavy metal sensor [Tropicimonas aquimaris]|uniref:Periplasmic heavy metal sensor n=1 Tax=Tropicimonas aquimaris TaxID=914152 RepID=A0ABW3IKN0_9RHOB
MTENSPTPATPQNAPRSRLWLRVLLFVSLALNLAVAGVVLGTVLQVRKVEDARPDRITRELGLGPFLFALDEENRKALRDASRNRDKDLAAGRAEWRDALRESILLLRQEPFDRERFLHLVQRQAEIAARGRMIGQEELTLRLAAMSPEERNAFADRLERTMRFGERSDKAKPSSAMGNGRHNDGERQPRP